MSLHLLVTLALLSTAVVQLRGQQDGCRMTPEDLETNFLSNCRTVLGSSPGDTTCTLAWNGFMSAFVGVAQETVMPRQGTTLIAS